MILDNDINMYLDNRSTSSYIGNGTKVPAPPKKGEILICQMCGQPLLPEHFSKDERKRKREFKWHIHPQCFDTMDEIADRSVPGLLAERKKANGND